VLLCQNASWLSQVDALVIECHEGFGRDKLNEIAREHGFGEARLLPGGLYLLVRPTNNSGNSWLKS